MVTRLMERDIIKIDSLYVGEEDAGNKWFSICQNKRGANGQTYFITSQRNFSAASGATSYLAIMAYMSDTVRKLGFQANVARCIQFDARLLLLLRLLSYLVL